MASDTIIQKLNDHVAQGLNKESDVIYVLVQLVKLLARQKSTPTFPALTFYRNWAVHEKLARVESNREMKVILDGFEAVLQQASQGEADVRTLAQGLADSISLSRLEAWRTERGERTAGAESCHQVTAMPETAYTGRVR